MNTQTNASYPYNQSKSWPFEETTTILLDKDLYEDEEGSMLDDIVLGRTQDGDMVAIQELLVVGKILHITWYHVGSDSLQTTNIYLTSKTGQAILAVFPGSYMSLTYEEALARWPMINLT